MHLNMIVGMTTEASSSGRQPVLVGPASALERSYKVTARTEADTYGPYNWRSLILLIRNLIAGCALVLNSSCLSAGSLAMIFPSHGCMHKDVCQSATEIETVY